MDPARDRLAANSAPKRQRRLVSKRRARQRSVFTRARRWLKPPRRLRPTRAGWYFFLLIFGVGFAALNTGNNLLYLVFALMLSFLVLSGVLSEAALRGIQVRRRTPREMFAERDTRVALEVSNDQRRVAAFAVVVEDRVAGSEHADHSAGRCFALRIAPQATETRSYALRPEDRGPLDFCGFVVSTRFPFGLFLKSMVIEAEESALVYPAVDPLMIPEDEGDAARRGESTATEVGGTSAVAAGLRSYVSGDPRRRIHWRASLRAGSLLVRELESECDAEALVRLRLEAGRPDEDFERHVRRAASEVVALLDAGRRVALQAGEQHFEADAGANHRARLLGFLARVQPCGAKTP